MGRTRFHLDHLFARRRLSAYVDGELEPRDRDRVRRHLGQCPDCGWAERSLMTLLGRLRLLRRAQPSGAADLVIQRVREADRPPHTRGRR